ncbi:DUF2845 domain-containing protein [Dyella sp. 2RAF44]|jgi:hypothetical protein
MCLSVLLFACAAHAGSGTLRVGSQVLVVGDSATRVLELLGKPSYRSHAASSSSSHRGSRRSRRHGGRSTSSGGEQWQYRQGSRVVTIVVADGKVSAIRDDGH